jgi:hypothetical protein
MFLTPTGINMVFYLQHKVEAKNNPHGLKSITKKEAKALLATAGRYMSTAINANVATVAECDFYSATL